ncbi:MAG TPA: Fe-S cluster assembly protein SufD [Thermoanaerobaculia bacterium]|nr:Fe-S cluster assembly protein SufD [Thermoanaerobaculia bacterium]
MTVATQSDSRIDAFARLQEGLKASTPFLQRFREEGMARFAALGFPSTRQEEWKYTSVAPIVSTDFAVATNLESRVDRDRIAGWMLGNDAMAELVFVNGHFSESLSRLSGLPDGIRIENLARRFDEALVQDHLGALADGTGHPFVALNAGLLQDGALVHLADGAVAAKPIHLLFLTVAGAKPAIASPRILVIAERNTQATVIESWCGEEGESLTLTNAVTEIFTADNALLQHIKMQQESPRAYHLATLHQRQGRASSFASHSISLGARLARNDIRAILDGEGADCVLNGLYLLEDDQHLDNKTLIDHASPHATSRELYKGMLDGRSRGIFEGKIIVRQDAQKTNARQTNNNLILSREAIANSTPQLEIYADDVKCAHGSTIGRLEENAVFYLRSRGIEEQQARAILMHGFAKEVVDPIPVEALRRRIEALLLSRLPGGGEGVGS